MCFEKMQALGNDFIFIKESDCLNKDYSGMAIKLCRRRMGIGADGLIVIKKNPLEMRIFNQDGSEAKMCGNAARCFIGLIKEWQWTDSDLFEILCSNKKYLCRKGIESNDVFFPHVAFEAENDLIEKKEWVNQNLDIYGVLVPCSIVNAGCVHTVVFDEEDLYKPFAADISTHPVFKDGCNVDFVKLKSENEIEVITYERGVGFTLSCGSGNVASAFAAWKNQKISSSIRVKNRGGVCRIQIEEDGIWLCGQCRHIFSGRIDLDEVMKDEQ